MARDRDFAYSPALKVDVDGSPSSNNLGPLYNVNVGHTKLDMMRPGVSPIHDQIGQMSFSIDDYRVSLVNGKV